MRATLLALLGLSQVATTALAGDKPSHPGAANYQLCAACHLETGAGVPGAFPPLQETILDLARTDEGRGYLAYVLLKGVSGRIEVAGHRYMGVMPGVAAGLDDSDLADLLNYVVSQIAAPDDAQASGQEPPKAFVADEIATHRAEFIEQHSQQSVLEVRSKALAKITNTNGD